MKYESDPPPLLIIGIIMALAILALCMLIALNQETFGYMDWQTYNTGFRPRDFQRKLQGKYHSEINDYLYAQGLTLDQWHKQHEKYQKENARQIQRRGERSASRRPKMKELTHLEIIKDLKMEEGFRGKPYLDTLGHITIGVGHSVTGRKFTDEEYKVLFPDEKPDSTATMRDYWMRKPMTSKQAEFLLDQDLAICEKEAQGIFKDQYTNFPVRIKVSILDLLFNLGGTKYRKFKKHIQAIKDGDWDKAADEIQNSLAAAQVPHRYNVIARRLRGE